MAYENLLRSLNSWNERDEHLLSYRYANLAIHQLWRLRKTNFNFARHALKCRFYSCNNSSQAIFLHLTRLREHMNAVIEYCWMIPANPSKLDYLRIVRLNNKQKKYFICSLRAHEAADWKMLIFSPFALHSADSIRYCSIQPNIHFVQS